jgi:hypothetical protein
VTDLFWQLYELDAFAYYMTAALTIAVCWFVRELVGSTMLALLAAPVLMAAGLGAHLAFRAGMITLAIDKDSNVAMMSAIGVFVGLMLVVSCKWLLTLWKEHRVHNTKLAKAVRTAR